MFSLSYPATIRPESNGRGYHVRFPSLPEALTGGTHFPDVLDEAMDCLGEALSGRIIRSEAIPIPTRPQRGQHPIPVPLYLAPKLVLYMTMRERRVSNTALARRLGVSETVVRRLLNPRHVSKPEKIEAALRAIGKRIIVAVDDAA